MGRGLPAQSPPRIRRDCPAIADGPDLFDGILYYGELRHYGENAEVRETASPLTALTVVHDEFSAYRMTLFSGYRPTVIWDSAGTRLGNISLREQQGEYRRPYVRRKTPGADDDDLIKLWVQIAAGKWDHLFLGALETKALRLVTLWDAVEHAEVVRRLGQTNGSKIANALDNLTLNGWIKKTGDNYHLGQFALKLRAFLDWVPAETAPNAYAHLLNADGSMSVTKLKRASAVARIGLLLQRSGRQTALGRRLDIRWLRPRHRLADRYFPDMYMRIRWREDLLWVPLEYADTETNVERARERLQVHKSRYRAGQAWQNGDPPAVYVVAGNASIEQAILAAGSDLPMATILLEELHTQCRSGPGPSWRLHEPVVPASQPPGIAGAPQPPAPQPPATAPAAVRKQPAAPGRPAPIRQPGSTTPGPTRESPPDVDGRRQAPPEPKLTSSFGQWIRKVVIGERKRSG